MKSLFEYMNEKMMTESSDTKEIKFNFTDLENAEETIKSLESMDNVTKTSDNEITVTVTAQNSDKLDTVVDILQQYCNVIRHSSKRSSSEQYAQKTVKFEKTLSSLHSAIDEFNDAAEEKDKKEEE